MSFNIRPLADIQERILRAFSPGQEYFVMGFDILGMTLDPYEETIQHYVEWLKTFPYLNRAVDKFHELNDGLMVIPFVVPILNGHKPGHGTYKDTGEICKDIRTVIDRYVTNDFDLDIGLVFNTDEVISRLESGSRFMHCGAVQNPTKSQIRNREMKYLSGFNFKHN